MDKVRRRVEARVEVSAWRGRGEGTERVSRGRGEGAWRGCGRWE